MILRRLTQSDAGTFGVLLSDDGAPLLSSQDIVTLEPAPHATDHDRGCAPTGTYPLVLEYSPHFRRALYELKDVPGRSEIKIHAGNTIEDTEGCILVGASRGSIDTTNGILYSRATLDAVMALLEGVERTTLTIEDPATPEEPV